jgi:hypothetical protein
LRWLRLTRLDALVLVPAAVFLAVHARIAHKEGQFILAAYPALLYVGALGASACVVEAGDQPLGVYGRGQMGFGARTAFHAFNAYELRPERADWSECVYAMLSPSRLAAFQSAAEGWGWHWTCARHAAGP